MTQVAKATDVLAAFEAVDEWDEFAVLALKAAPELWEQIAEIAERKFANGRAEILRLITPIRAVRLAAVSERLAKAKVSIWPDVLPGREVAAAKQAEIVPFKRRDLTAFLAKEAAKEQRLLSVLAAKPKPKPEVEPPEPEPEVEPEPEAAPKAKAKTDEKPKPFVLDPSDPLSSAHEFAQSICVDGVPTVCYCLTEWWRFNGQVWEKEAKGAPILRKDMWRFLGSAKKRDEARFKPQPMQVNAAIDALESELLQEKTPTPSMWLDTGKVVPELVVFKNGIVNLLGGEVQPLTHKFWAYTALDFDWDPKAVCPRWERFLEEIFPGDGESQQFIEEFMGYCMTDNMNLEKGAMLIGITRSGKSTIGYLMGQLVGDRAYAGLSFNNWLAGENSAQNLVGKRVGVFADARFKAGKRYGNVGYDPGGLDHRSREMLLNITGQDKTAIGQKYESKWEGQLRLKIVMVSNVVPNLNDDSGVLMGRFIKVWFGVSFLNREDKELRRKLKAELPGIAVRCAMAYRRLIARGRFVQPSSAEALQQDLLSESNPFMAMALQCFEPKPGTGAFAYFADLWERFEDWCDYNGCRYLLDSVNKRNFITALKGIPGFEHIARYRPHGDERAWKGIRLRAIDLGRGRRRTAKDFLDSPGS
jgi:putative DNA primase/helicase